MQTLLIVPASSGRVARLWSLTMPKWMREAGRILFISPEPDILARYCDAPIRIPTLLLLDGDARIRYWQHGAIVGANGRDRLEAALRKIAQASGSRGLRDATDLALPSTRALEDLPTSLVEKLDMSGVTREETGREPAMIVLTFLSGDPVKDEGRIRSVARFRDAPGVRVVLVAPAGRPRLQEMGRSLSYVPNRLPIVVDSKRLMAKALGVQRFPATIMVVGSKVVYNDAKPSHYGVGPDLENDLCSILLGWRGCWEAQVIFDTNAASRG